MNHKMYLCYSKININEDNSEEADVPIYIEKTIAKPRRI